MRMQISREWKIISVGKLKGDRVKFLK
jgi:hypothetical protein